jgi:hypothetical protein
MDKFEDVVSEYERYKEFIIDISEFALYGNPLSKRESEILKNQVCDLILSSTKIIVDDFYYYVHNTKTPFYNGDIIKEEPRRFEYFTDVINYLSCLCKYTPLQIVNRMTDSDDVDTLDIKRKYLLYNPFTSILRQ